MSDTIYDLALTIINSLMQTLILRQKSAAFKLGFHNSDSRPSKALNNKGPGLCTLQLFKVSAKAASTPEATADKTF